MDPRDERWALQYPGDVAELEANARRELASPAPAPPVGADPSNAVRVAVNADLQVEAIEVSRGWKDQLGSANFSTALFEAYTDGLAKALDHQAVASLLAGGSGAVGESLVLPPWPDPEDGGWFRELRENVADLDGQLESYIRMGQRGEVDDTYDRELTSPEEMFTMRLRGATAVGITGDIEKIRRADAESLRLEALDLFRAAHLTARG